MCLLIGPAGAGKTVLLKKLQRALWTLHNIITPVAKSPASEYLSTNKQSSLNSDHSLPSTIPTVGTNLVTLPLPRKVDLTVRELGGSIAPIWNNYYQDCSSVLFVIDVSNPLQVSSACIQLLTVLTESKLINKPLLLILNKVDVQNHMTDTEIENVLHLKEILHHSDNRVTVVRASSYTGRGLSDVLQWLQTVSK